MLLELVVRLMLDGGGRSRGSCAPTLVEDEKRSCVVGGEAGPDWACSYYMDVLADSLAQNRARQSHTRIDTAMTRPPNQYEVPARCAAGKRVWWGWVVVGGCSIFVVEVLMRFDCFCYFLFRKYYFNHRKTMVPVRDNTTVN